MFIENHGFNLGENGLSFLGLFVGAIVAFAGFCPYAIYYLKPMFRDGEESTFCPDFLFCPTTKLR